MSNTITPYSFSNLTSPLLDNIFDFSRRSIFDGFRSNLGFSMDIIEQDDHMILRSSLPGVLKENIRIKINDGILTISAENHYVDEENTKVYTREISSGVYTRSVRLPNYIDTGAVDAKLENGILTIILPRLPEVKSDRSINVPIN